MNHFEGARSSILMPYIFVGFDIFHQSHSRRYLALLRKHPMQAVLESLQ